MSSDNALWSTSANEALSLSLVTQSDAGLKKIATFHPKFTYPLFGDEQRIFGYRDLEIHLYFNANDMRPCCLIDYAKKFKPVGETKAQDLKEILREFLPHVAFQTQSEFELAISRMSNDWKPPGSLHSSFKSKGEEYEVWKGSLEDPVVKQFVERIQILVSLFVEGGRPIVLTDPDTDQWTFFFLFQKKPVPGKDGKFSYIFAGYTTVYRFFFLDTPTSSPPISEKPLDELRGDFDLNSRPCRSRISQFIILPPFQRRGLGDRLYSIIYKLYLNHPATQEITVEDPSEAFDDLRDLADLRFLRQLPEFNALHVNTDVKIPKTGMSPSNIVDKAAWEAVRKRAKIAPRQFARVLEMHLMSKLPESVRAGITTEESRKVVTAAEKHEYDLWRLLLKQRIYRQNKDTLGQLELPERIDRLNEAASSVEFDYARLLAIADGRDQGNEEGSRKGKRRLDEDDEAPTSKKARVEDDQ